MNSFFTSLPAILGVVAFVIYQIVRKSLTKDPVVTLVLEKIKYKDPEFYNQYQQADSKHKEELLRKNEELRSHLSQQELQIFENTLKRQYRTTIFVYSLCGTLLLAGVVLFIYQSNKPVPLKISNIEVQDTDSSARKVAVDLDPLTVTWTSTGRDETVYAILENVETGQQTKKKRVIASEGKIVFPSDRYDNYDKILSNRMPLQSNRIRAIIYGEKEAFTSREFEIKVGVRLYCLASLPDLIECFAAIDNTTVDNYHFLPKLTLFGSEHFSDPVELRGSEMGSHFTFHVPHPEKISVKNYVLAYENPQDDRIVRSEVDLSEFLKLQNHSKSKK